MRVGSGTERAASIGWWALCPGRTHLGSFVLTTDSRASEGPAWSGPTAAENHLRGQSDVPERGFNGGARSLQEGGALLASFICGRSFRGRARHLVAASPRTMRAGGHRVRAVPIWGSSSRRTPGLRRGQRGPVRCRSTRVGTDTLCPLIPVAC